MAEQLQVLHQSDTCLPYVRTVESHGLYSTVTTLHEGQDYRLRPTMCRMRDSYETGEISVMQWIPGKQNLADALTKRNIVMYKTLSEVLVSGTLRVSVVEGAQRTKHGEERRRVRFNH